MLEKIRKFIWRDKRERKKLEKARRLRSIEMAEYLLKKNNIEFKKVNEGAQFLIETPDSTISFSPSTRLFVQTIIRKDRGIFRLMTLCKTPPVKPSGKERMRKFFRPLTDIIDRKLEFIRIRRAGRRKKYYG